MNQTKELALLLCQHPIFDRIKFSNCLSLYQHFVDVLAKQVVMPSHDKFDQLGAYRITLVQRPDSKHWRLGLNWRSENDFLFICEYPTIDECLDTTIDFIQRKNKP